MVWLVIGSNGLLGRHAAAALRASGERVLCASHQPGANLRLDLRETLDGLAEALPTELTHAFVCSGETNLDACCHDPHGTALLNVTRMIELLVMLLRRGIQPIFCSSQAVFKGDRGGYREEDPREPSTEYGRQKKVVEDFLLSQQAPWLIIRMSKLYSLEREDPSPVGQMLRALNLGQAVRCADDQVIVPTCVDDIPRAVYLLAQRHASGVYHLAAPRRYTRYSLGMAVARAVGREDLVQRCSIRDFTFDEPRPLDNSLDVTRFLTSTGFAFTAFEESLPHILRRWERAGSPDMAAVKLFDRDPRPI